MIDGKDLDQMLEGAERAAAAAMPRDDHECRVQHEGLRRARETIRLARLGLECEQDALVDHVRDPNGDRLRREAYLRELGLWAEKHAVPALHKIGVDSGSNDPRRVGHIAYGLFVTSTAVDALSHLPKEDV